MRILVLGATGFIGRSMAEHFARSGHEVYGVANKSQPLLKELPTVFWTIHDLRNEDEIKNLLFASKPGIVIQAAATTSGSKDIVNNPAVHVTDNAVMNALIFRAAVEAKVKHLIFFSCTTMFSNGCVTEDSPIDIHPRYFGVAHTKLYAEKMCEFYAGVSDTKFTVIRHSNVFGPNDKFDLEKSHLMGATVTKVMTAGALRPSAGMGATEATNRNSEGGKVTVWGSGEESRDLLYVDDLCSFVEAAIERQPEKFGLYNCGAGRAVAVKDLVRRVIALSGKNLEIEYDLSKPTIPTSLWLDCAKAKNELGWEPRVGLDEGIVRTLNWWRENVG